MFFQQSKTATYKNISPQDAKKRLEEDKNIILVDVRTPAEYSQGHIPGSILIPLDTITTMASQKLNDKDTEIFVYCQSGGRSQMAARELARMGYTRIYNLGGVIYWPYEIEK